MPRPVKRSRIESSLELDPIHSGQSRSPSPYHDNDKNDEDEETSASHLVSFLTGYADHHSSGSSDEDDHNDNDNDNDKDEFGFSDDEDPEDEEERERDTPRKSRSGLIGTSTPKKTPRKNRTATGSKITPRKGQTPKKTRLGFDEQQGERGEVGGIIRASRSDSYFLSQSRANRSSNNAYSSLAKPLSQKSYERYLLHASNTRNKLIPPKSFENRYGQWIEELDQGYNLLFYGFGSKRQTINRFATEKLSRKGNVVIINGLYPQLGIRDILNQIEDTLQVPQSQTTIPPSFASTPIDRSVYRIYEYFLSPQAIPPTGPGLKLNVASAPLYLIIHNIDSTSLRSPKSLSILSLLASSPRIHIIATFDHLHTPILFSSSISSTPSHSFDDHRKWDGIIPPSRGFNWLYHNLTTYSSYSTELSYLRLSANSSVSLAGTGAGGAGGISEEGALQILRSVPPMAARLLKLLLTRQIQNLPSDPKSHIAYPVNPVAPSFAVDNDILQTLAREKFIAREEERFNALIGEYKDHGLVVEAILDNEGRSGKWVWVPLGKAAIERVLQTMLDVEV